MLRSAAGHRNISVGLNVSMRATREQLRPVEGKFKSGRTRGRRNGGGINSNGVLGSLTTIFPPLLLSFCPSILHEILFPPTWTYIFELSTTSHATNCAQAPSCRSSTSLIGCEIILKNSIDSRERSALYCTLADRAILPIEIYYPPLYETKAIDERRFISSNDRSKVSYKNMFEGDPFPLKFKLQLAV